MELALIRHGATEWNATGRFQGRSDVPLAPLGRAQARAAAEALRPLRIERVYASDLGRALETAEIVSAATGAPLVRDARLREFDFGRWEGLTWPEILAAHPDIATAARTSAATYTPVDGESFAEVSERVRGFLDEIARSRESRAAVVTHAGTLHAFFSVLGIDENAAAKRIVFASGGITRVTVKNGRGRLLSLNDVAHLDAVE